MANSLLSESKLNYLTCSIALEILGVERDSCPIEAQPLKSSPEIHPVNSIFIKVIIKYSI